MSIKKFSFNRALCATADAHFFKTIITRRVMLPTRKIGPLGSVVPNKFVPQYRPSISSTPKPVSEPPKSSGTLEPFVQNTPPTNNKNNQPLTQYASVDQLLSISNVSNKEDVPKKVHFGENQILTAPFQPATVQSNQPKQPHTTPQQEFHAIAQATPSAFHEEDDLDASFFFEGKAGPQTSANTNSSSSSSFRSFAPNIPGNSSSRATNSSEFAHSNLTIHPAAVLETRTGDFGEYLPLENNPETRKRKSDGSSGEDGNTNKTDLSTVSTSKKAKASSSSNSTKKKSKSPKQHPIKPLFPISYLKLIHHPLANELDIVSIQKMVKHQRIMTQLRLGPTGIPGIQFTNYDNRAVITAIHPVFFTDSPNGKYKLQLYDVIISVNHLDAKNCTFDQLMRSLNHINDMWDGGESREANNSSTNNSNVDANLENNNLREGTDSIPPKTTSEQIMSAFTVNTNIYISDLNDPNYHSNRSSLKNAIIESMACVVFGRIENVAQ